MNTVTHTAESLAQLPRKALIALAVEAGIAKAHNTKSSALIEGILNADTANVEAETDTVVAVEDPVVEAPAVESASTTEAPADNVVPFDAAAPVQAELPAEPVATVSRGLFKVNRKGFHRQLTAAAKIVTGQSNMPILSCVLISFGDGRVKVEANDLSNHLVTEAQAETTDSYSVAIQHAVLTKFVGKCVSEFLMAEVRNDTLVISDLENRTEIMGIPATEWPPAPEAGTIASMEIAGKQLVRAVAETIKCASKDETRYVLNGIGIDTTAGVLIATDGRRLVKAPLGADVLHASESVLILPTHAANILSASVPQDVPVKVTISERGNALHFRTEAVGFTYALTTRLVDGRFPNYEQVIPKSVGTYGIAYSIANAELVAALGRLAVVANASGKDNALKLNLDASGLMMTVANVSVGNAKEQVAATGGNNGFPQFVALNGDYLSEIVASWGDEKVLVRVQDAISPVLLEAGGKIAVVMPVRLN